MNNLKEQWHLSKSISVSHLVATGMMVVSVFAYINSFDKRLTENEIEVSHIKETRIADMKRGDEKYREMKADLKEINRKLDRLIETRQ